MAIWESILWMPKLVEEEKPPEKMTGVEIIKLVEEDSWAETERAAAIKTRLVHKNIKHRFCLKNILVAIILPLLAYIIKIAMFLLSRKAKHLAHEEW